MNTYPRVESIRIQGYKPFRAFQATNLGALEVLVGANASGKTSLLEFLRFLRDGMERPIPPDIVAGSIGQQIFHKPGPDRFHWQLRFRTEEDGDQVQFSYEGEVMGPVGRHKVVEEHVRKEHPPGGPSHDLLRVRDGKAEILECSAGSTRPVSVPSRGNQLTLSTVSDPRFPELQNLRECIRNWKFYNSFDLDREKIRHPAVVEQEPILWEDAGNLSSVLHFVVTEHRSIFDEFQLYLRLAVPGFESLTVKARGGPGQVIACWREKGVDPELTIADLSDGVLHMLCWIVLCLQPNPPSLICIDEPDLGLHPRVLPILAGIFEKACNRTQILLATHASYFLTQFDISRIAVFRKENGEAKFIKPKDSAALRANLEDFGPDEIEAMHRSDELEQLT